MTDGTRSAALIGYEIYDRVVVITLNRPEKRNAINLDLAHGLQDALERFARDESLRVAVLAGAGPSFCAGGDIEMFPNLDTASGLSFVRDLGEPIYKFFLRTRKPVIAAVHGFCLAGGFELALACSFIYCSADAQFGMEEIRLGLIPGWGGTVRLARAVPVRLATEMLLAGRRLDASQAQAAGIANRVLVDADECLNQAVATATEIAAMPLLAVQLAVDVIRAARPDSETAYDTEQLAAAVLFGDASTQDAIRTVLERGIRRRES